MLDLALKARIPIVSVRTTDLVNLELMLRDIAGGRTISMSPQWTKASPGDVVVFHGWHDKIDNEFYKEMVRKQLTFLMINPSEGEGGISSFVFDAGWLYPSTELLMSYLNKALKIDLPELHAAVSGLTIMRMVDLIRLTQAKYGTITANSFRSIRHSVLGMTKGISDVHIDLSSYQKDELLEKWVGINKRFFIDAPDHRLVPRGVLLVGPPGVGKTMGAKYIARRMGCPLYRLDLTSSLSKWVGESEANFGSVLAVIDKEEPCVLLIDEVEKVFNKQEDGSGTNSRLMSQLLWWLQEHQSRVLTVMTSNDQDKLPRELYRAGRIDATFYMPRLSSQAAIKFAKELLITFDNHGDLMHNTTMLIKKIESRMVSQDSSQISHAEVVVLVHDFVKQVLYKEK